MDQDTATAKLIEMDRELGQLVHSINNPMTVIAGNAQLLLELASAGELDAMVEGAVRDIETATLSLSELMDRLARFRKEVEVEVNGMDVLTGS